MDEIAITFMSGPQDGAVLSFETPQENDDPTALTIGRREGCDVCLNYDSQVSREHALITVEDGHFWLEDTNSTNGTFVRGEKINERVEIQPGELFRIGRTWLRVEPTTSTTDIDDENLPF
jgi:pSer/pThr/pTyr-binding forkhead associated (FHA) protein